jgi:hypothetical protein
VGWKWKGLNLSYLFLLLAVCWIPPTLSMRDKMLHSLETSHIDLVNQIPEIHIVNGTVTVDQIQPYYITRKDGTPLMIIDTTGSMNYIDNAHVMALLTERKLIVRSGKNHFNTLELSQVSDFHLNQQIVNDWLYTLKDSIAPLSYGIFLMLSYIFTVLVLLLIAVVGLIVSAATRTALKFPAIVRIASTAATPAIILISLSAALGFALPGSVYLMVTILYLFIGIQACRQPADEKDLPSLNLKALLG